MTRFYADVLDSNRGPFVPAIADGHEARKPPGCVPQALSAAVPQIRPPGGSYDRVSVSGTRGMPCDHRS